MKKYAVRSLMVCCLLSSTLSFCPGGEGDRSPSKGSTPTGKGESISSLMSWLPQQFSGPVVFGMAVLYAVYNEWDKLNTKENVGFLRKDADQTNKNVECIAQHVEENRKKILENKASNEGHAPVVNSKHQPTKTTSSDSESGHSSLDLETKKPYRV